MIQKLGSIVPYFAMTLAGKNVCRKLRARVCVCVRVSLFVYGRKTEWAIIDNNDVVRETNRNE